MRCRKCGTESKTSRKFCATCGSPLSSRCPKCSAENAPSSAFCEDCGTALAGDAASAATSSSQGATTAPEIRVTPERPDASTTIDGERKTVTALFADIKGATELMRDLDPEEARAIVDPVLQLMMDAVHRYGGYVQNFPLCVSQFAAAPRIELCPAGWPEAVAANGQEFATDAIGRHKRPCEPSPLATLTTS